MHCGSTGSCQSAATSDTIKCSGHESDSCKWRYSNCPDLTFKINFELKFAYINGCKNIRIDSSCTLTIHTDEMFFQLDGRVEAFSTHVADVVFGSVRVVAKLIVLVKKLLFPCRVVAHLTLVNVRIVAVVFLVQNYSPTKTPVNSSKINSINVEHITPVSEDLH